MAWMVAQTKSNLERKVARKLRLAGMKYYLPEYVGLSRKRQLLYPGYIFIKLHPDWRNVFSTEGVLQLFLVGDKPALIKNEFVKNLQSLEDDKGIIRFRLRLGQRVRVLRGKFKDLIATYAGYDNRRKRDVAEVHLLGRKVPVEFKPGHLSAEF